MQGKPDRRFDSVDSRLAEHTEKTDRRFDAVDSRLAEHTEKTDRRFDSVDNRLAEHTEKTDRRFDAVDRRLNALAESVASLAETAASLVEHAKSVELRLQALETGMAVSNRHIGELKGKFMERDVVDNAALVASDMGLVWQKSLDRQEVVALVDEAVRTGKAEGIPTNHLRTLRRADLVMEAGDERGRSSYVVAEISWTAAERDTDRAIRNAGYVALFTGRTTYAAVASVHIDKEIADVLTQDAPQPHGSAKYEKAFHAVVDDPPSPD